MWARSHRSLTGASAPVPPAGGGSSFLDADGYVDEVNDGEFFPCFQPRHRSPLEGHQPGRSPRARWRQIGVRLSAGTIFCVTGGVLASGTGRIGARTLAALLEVPARTGDVHRCRGFAQRP
jgi:hypothetical protein